MADDEAIGFMVYSTLRDPPAPPAPMRVAARRGLPNIELERQLRGFFNFAIETGGPMTQRLYSVLRHVMRTRWEFSIHVTPDQLDSFHAWCEAANAIYFDPAWAIRDPQGRVLSGPDTPEEERTGQAPHPADALRRRERSTAALIAEGHAVPAFLPPVVAEPEVVLRAPKEAARRCMALAVVAARADGLSRGRPIAAAALRKMLPLGFGHFSPAEQSFMEEGGLVTGLRRVFGGEKPAKAITIVAATWRSECAAILLWALGHTESLPSPHEVCDVAALSDHLFAVNTPAFVDKAALRPAPEILDALDRYYRLHWLTTEARAQNAQAPADLEPGAILERHYALNWLVRDGDAEWDDVQTAT